VYYRTRPRHAQPGQHSDDSFCHSGEVPLESEGQSSSLLQCLASLTYRPPHAVIDVGQAMRVQMSLLGTRTVLRAVQPSRRCVHRLLNTKISAARTTRFPCFNRPVAGSLVVVLSPMLLPCRSERTWYSNDIILSSCLTICHAMNLLHRDDMQWSLSPRTT